MMFSPEDAMRQAKMTAHDYGLQARRDLLAMLDIPADAPDWRERLAPFAPVWAAMITAAATDYDTAIKCGVADGHGLHVHARVEGRIEADRDGA